MKFYTDVEVRGSTVYHRFIENGVRKKEKTSAFSPTLFTNGAPDYSVANSYRDLFGQVVKPKKFDTIADAKQFVKNMRDVSGMTFYGVQDYTLLFLNDTYPSPVEYDISKIRIGILDIEVSVPDGEGFPDPADAAWPINLITIHDSTTNTFFTFGEHPYTPKSSNVRYLCEPDEKKRLLKFVQFMQTVEFDVLSGWYSSTFDLPYIFRRIENLFGEHVASKLSPWEKYSWKNEDRDDVRAEVVISGVAQLDYIELYKKHVPGEKENYKLDTIARIELGETKVAYEEEYGSLYNFAEGNLVVTEEPDPADEMYEIKLKAYKVHLIEQELIKRGVNF